MVQTRALNLEDENYVEWSKESFWKKVDLDNHAYI